MVEASAELQETEKFSGDMGNLCESDKLGTCPVQDAHVGFAW